MVGENFGIFDLRFVFWYLIWGLAIGVVLIVFKVKDSRGEKRAEERKKSMETPLKKLKGTEEEIEETLERIEKLM
jgi:uncharacterized membrane protein